MANEYQDKGEWKNPDTGTEVSFSFTFDRIDSFADAVKIYGNEKEACRHLQRMNKTDARNKKAASEKANAGFGAPKLSEAEKAGKKAERVANKALLEKLKANPELLAQLQNE